MRGAGLWRTSKANVVAAVVFAIIALAEGLFMIGDIDAKSLPDPTMHIPQTYALATGQVFNPTEFQTDEWGNHFRRQNLKGDSYYLEPDGNNSLLMNVISQIGKSNAYHSEDNGSQTVSGLYRSTQYFPASYIPQAVGMKIGMMLHMSHYKTLQMARGVNLLTFIAMVAFAIILLPRGKLLMLALGLLPMTVYTASSMMPDGLYFAASACMVAVAMYGLRSERRMSNGLYVFLIVISLWILLGKSLYLVAALPVLLLPKVVLSWKRKLGYVGVMCIGLVLYLLWSSAYSGGFFAANVADNKGYILHDPVHFVIVVLKNALHVYSELIIMPHGYWWVALAITVITVGSAVYGFVTDWKRERSNFTVVYVASVVVSFFLGICAIYAFTALTWNDLSNMSQGIDLEGFQGRYILPLLPSAAFLSVWGKRI